MPFEGTTLPAWFLKADVHGPAPTVVMFDGLDNAKEMSVLFGGIEIASRGIHTLAIDGPGQGEALRLQGIPSRYDYEVPARAAYEYVSPAARSRSEARAVMAFSMGGYYAPRAAAMEPALRRVRRLGRALRLSRVVDPAAQDHGVGRHQALGALFPVAVGARHAGHGRLHEEARGTIASPASPRKSAARSLPSTARTTPSCPLDIRASALRRGGLQEQDPTGCLPPTRAAASTARKTIARSARIIVADWLADNL